MLLRETNNRLLTINTLHAILTCQEQPLVQPSLWTKPPASLVAPPCKRVWVYCPDQCQEETPKPVGCQRQNALSSRSFGGFMPPFPSQARGAQTQLELREMKRFPTQAKKKNNKKAVTLISGFQILVRHLRDNTV